ncbi:MAG: hypothetical protein M1825_002703 [Sarcosagium campestre]|nr:MAG: hypothetical protein M1825_002703 [Sarcosagium campestre]
MPQGSTSSHLAQRAEPQQCGGFTADKDLASCQSNCRRGRKRPWPSEDLRLSRGPASCASLRTVDVDSSFEKRRKRLLDQDDWVGTAVARPLNIKFQAVEDRNKLGKRRYIDPLDRRPAVLTDSHVCSPFRRKEKHRTSTIRRPDGFHGARSIDADRRQLRDDSPCGLEQDRVMQVIDAESLMGLEAIQSGSPLSGKEDVGDASGSTTSHIQEQVTRRFPSPAALLDELSSMQPKIDLSMQPNIEADSAAEESAYDGIGTTDEDWPFDDDPKDETELAVDDSYEDGALNSAQDNDEGRWRALLGLHDDDDDLHSQDRDYDDGIDSVPSHSTIQSTYASRRELDTASRGAERAAAADDTTLDTSQAIADLAPPSSISPYALRPTTPVLLSTTTATTATSISRSRGSPCQSSTTANTPSLSPPPTGSTTVRSPYFPITPVKARRKFDSIATRETSSPLSDGYASYRTTRYPSALRS